MPDSPNTAIATTPKARMDSLRMLLEKARPSMAAVVPRHVTPERLVKLALVAASKNPVLLQCDQTSILQSVMTAAQLGLDCGGTIGSAYLVPYKNNRTGRFEAQLIVGYRGLVDLARRSGEIESIEAHVVYTDDEFEIAYGLEPVLRHVPNLKGDRGEAILVYAIGRLKGGARQVEVMTKADVERIRSRSRAGTSGPWVTDWDEMARKTVVRRLCKYLPLSTELAEAIAADDRSESGTVELPQVEIDSIESEAHDDLTEPAAVVETKAHRLAADLKARKAEEAA